MEQLDQEESASSSLDGVISMEGSCRYSLEPERERTGGRAVSRSLGTFLMRRILKRLRRSVGVDEQDFVEQSDAKWFPPSEYSGPSFGTLTWRDGGRSLSPMMLDLLFSNPLPPRSCTESFAVKEREKRYQ